MIHRLASLSLTFKTLIVLLIWLIGGSWLAAHDTYGDLVRTMNHELVASWLPRALDGEAPLVAGWFLVLCAIAFVLFVNQACCLWTRWLARIHWTRRRTLLFIMHLCFGLVMIGHASSFVLGFKEGRVKMVPGQSQTLGNGMTIEVLDTAFGGDVSILSLSGLDQRPLMTRQNFDYTRSGALIRLSRDGKELIKGWARPLMPLRLGHTQVTFREFFLRGDAIGGRMLITNYPLHTPFFGCYGLLILCMIVYLALTWRPMNARNNTQEVEA